MRALPLAVAFAGCWTGSSSTVETARETAGSSVRVRMATADDFVNAPRVTDPFDPRYAQDCLPWGEPAPNLFEPIAAFAREHFVKYLDRFGLPPSPEVHKRLVLPNVPEPPAMPGINITVTPMTELGQLEVANLWQDGHHTLKYCLRVLRQSDATIVAIRPEADIISAAER